MSNFHVSNRNSMKIRKSSNISNYSWKCSTVYFLGYFEKFYAWRCEKLNQMIKGSFQNYVWMVLYMFTEIHIELSTSQNGNRSLFWCFYIWKVTKTCDSMKRETILTLKNIIDLKYMWHYSSKELSFFDIFFSLGLATFFLIEMVLVALNSFNKETLCN